MVHLRSVLPLAVLLLATAVALVGGCGTNGENESEIARTEDLRVPDSPVLMRALESGTREEKVRAAVAMGRIQDAGYAEALSATAQDADVDVRKAAVFALGQLGLAEGAVPVPTAVEACRIALEDADSAVVAAAVQALGKLAPDGIAGTIVPYLEHESDVVRTEAAHALFRLRFVPVWRRQTPDPPPLPEPAVQALARALSDPAPEVRTAAAHAFSRYGQPEAAEALEAALADGHAWVRMFAARALGRSGSTGAVERLAECLDDESLHVRVEAVNAIALLGGYDSFPSELEHDPSFHVRAALANGLAGGRADRDIHTLRALEGDPSPSVSAAAIAALAQRLGDAYSDDLAAHLDDSNWSIRLAAADAAAHVESGRRELLDEAWADSHDGVRLAALRGLASMPDGRRFVEQALAEDDLAMRGTAVGLLATHGDGPEALELLLRAYDESAGTDWVEVRESVVDAVTEIDAGEASRALLRRIASEDPEFSVRRRAGVALTREVAEWPEVGAPSLEASRFLGRGFEEDPVVALETNKGTLRLRCFAAQAPIHVASFVDLVRKGHYDGLPWHRVVPNFVIQGGDPRGDGWGGAGYLLRDEINTERYTRGTVGMPKAGKDTGGGQLFVTHVPTPHLDGNYTVFARVIGGQEVIDEIEVGDRIVRAFVE